MENLSIGNPFEIKVGSIVTSKHSLLTQGLSHWTGVVTNIEGELVKIIRLDDGVEIEFLSRDLELV